MQSKIRVTPTQVELKLKLGCDKNIGLDMCCCAFSYISWMAWFGLVEGKPLNHITLLQPLTDIFRVCLVKDGCGGAELLCRVSFKSHQLKLNRS